MKHSPNRGAIKRVLTKQEQMSEAFVLSAFLALSGGFQDAYTYIVRNHVFANAQTGNIVLMSTYFMERRWAEGIGYLFPILAFAAGVFLAERIQFRFRHTRRLHWRQGILLMEMLIMLAVGFMPQRLNTLANVLISLACALQLQSFRTVSGYAYASTMCIGNLRSATAALSSYLRAKDRRELIKALCYFGVILIFAVGSGLGGLLSDLLGVRAIWISPAFLLVAFFLMELDRKP